MTLGTDLMTSVTLLFCALCLVCVITLAARSRRERRQLADLSRGVLELSGALVAIQRMNTETGRRIEMLAGKAATREGVEAVRAEFIRERALRITQNAKDGVRLERLEATVQTCRDTDEKLGSRVDDLLADQIIPISENTRTLAAALTGLNSQLPDPAISERQETRLSALTVELAAQSATISQMNGSMQSFLRVDALGPVFSRLAKLEGEKLTASNPTELVSKATRSKVSRQSTTKRTRPANDTMRTDA